MNTIQFSDYKAQYFAGCIGLFNSNLAHYFSADEMQDYRAFLNQLGNNSFYSVGFIDDQLQACGGWDIQHGRHFLRWGMVNGDAHQKGLGRQLLSHRIEQIKRLNGNVDIYIKTSGQAQGFFAHFGFIVDEIIPQGVSAEIDQYNMILRASTG